MKIIKLVNNRGQVKVDNDDYEKLIKYRWYIMGKKRNYVIASIMQNMKRRNICMHRLILNCLDEKCIVDHINGDTFDNRKINLRKCNDSENQYNTHKIRGKIKYKGVDYYKQNKNNPYRAKITINKKQIYLGNYDNPIDAAKAYDKAAIKYLGEFAKPNFN